MPLNLQIFIIKAILLSLGELLATLWRFLKAFLILSCQFLLNFYFLWFQVFVIVYFCGPRWHSCKSVTISQLRHVLCRIYIGATLGEEAHRLPGPFHSCISSSLLDKCWRRFQSLIVCYVVSKNILYFNVIGPSDLNTATRGSFGGLSLAFPIRIATPAQKLGSNSFLLWGHECSHFAIWC